MAQKKLREWPPSFEEVINGPLNGPLNDTKFNGHLNNGHLNNETPQRPHQLRAGRMTGIHSFDVLSAIERLALSLLDTLSLSLSLS